ncbi:hypothetical protein LSTR_LSTR009867 [Laodelphax striatellus]|uniref:Uncharacterized protein n=1 Tax=Laodelphax striatellus TaxID=195883 RepID=A0A482WH30_LAOST|nr:hypothetical protein LSTR_LSTR009867 [Laodelphax striatellus]
MIKNLLAILCLLASSGVISAVTERFQDSDRYKDNEAEVFHHGQVQTSDTATVEELYKHGLLDKHRSHEAPHSKPRPTKPLRPGLGVKYAAGVVGLPSNAHKITLMKTYYDPITNQPYMYVMRKRPQPHLQDNEDSFFNTASKLISTFLGPDEMYKPRMSAGGRGMKVGVAPPTQRVKRVPRSLRSIMDLHQSLNTVDNVQRIRTLQELSQHQSYNNLHDKTTNHNNEENEVDNGEEGDDNGQTTNKEDNEQADQPDNTKNSTEENMSSFEESLKIVQRLVTKCGHNFLSPKDNATEIYDKIKGCVQKHVLKAFDSV